MTVERALSTSRFEDCSILGLKLSFATPADEANDIARALRSKIVGKRTRFVYFDGDDDLCVEWPAVLAQVDCWLKKHAFADKLSYKRRYLGKSNLTDLVARDYGYSFNNDIIRFTEPLQTDGISKILVGWNIALDDKIINLAAEIAAVKPVVRDVDVCSRAFVLPETWIYPLRSPLVERIEAMRTNYNVLSPVERVSQQQYYAEMLRSRICVSPFGYGELCWRDFEAVLCGCLLVKPSMSHLHTYPSVFLPGESYAPVKWDYSDLADVCTRYLEDEPLRQRMVERAQSILFEALRADSFVSRFGALLDEVTKSSRSRAY